MDQASTIKTASCRLTDVNKQTAAQFRSDRCFNIDGSWYFNTRAGKVPHGPYLTKESALRAIGDYIVLMNSFILK